MRRERGGRGRGSGRGRCDSVFTTYALMPSESERNRTTERRGLSCRQRMRQPIQSHVPCHAIITFLCSFVPSQQHPVHPSPSFLPPAFPGVALPTFTHSTESSPTTTTTTTTTTTASLASASAAAPTRPRRAAAQQRKHNATHKAMAALLAPA